MPGRSSSLLSVWLVRLLCVSSLGLLLWVPWDLGSRISTCRFYVLLVDIYVLYFLYPFVIFFSNVAIGCGETIVRDEIIDFLLVLLLIQDYCRITLVCFGNHGLMFGQFVFYLICNFVFISSLYVTVIGSFILLFVQFRYVMCNLVCIYSCSPGGSNVVAVSASNARLLIHCLRLWLKLYFRPLFKSTSSSLEKVMLVWFITLG